jgi:Domain of unknown function (DUF5655)
MQPEDLFSEHAAALAVLEKVRSTLGSMADIGPIQTRTTKSQVAFRRKRGFAYLWRPGQYLARPGAEIVLSIALGRRDGSPRFKEVVHPAPARWMYHLELDRPADVDDEVVGWLREAALDAG